MIRSEAAIDVAPVTIGKYRVVGVLGTGAMGVVYKGLDPSLQRQVALKTIHRDLAEDERGEEFVARFRQEAQAAGRLNHPAIVGVYEYGEQGDIAYIAMEYVEGHTLRRYFQRGVRFEEDDFVSLALQLIGALAHAHAAGVIHRDIKPANLIITPSGRLKVADFGVARIDESTLTRIGALVGTPGYIAPEQYDKLPIDSRVDLYAAGVILYQMIAAEAPFAGPAELIAKRALSEPPRPPSEVAERSDLGRYDTIVARAMARDREARYPSAAAFKAALNEAYARPVSETLSAGTILHDVAVSPQVDGAKQDSRGAASHPQAGADRSGATAEGPPPRRRRRWALAGLFLLSIAALCAWLLDTSSVRRRLGITLATPPMSLSIVGFRTVGEDPVAHRIADNLPTELETFLVACCHTVSILSTHRNGPAGALSQTEDARYLVDGEVAAGDGAHVARVRLLDATSGTTVWTDRVRLIDLDGSLESLTQFRRLAGNIAGAVQSLEARRVQYLPLESLKCDELSARADQALRDGNTFDGIEESVRVLDFALGRYPNCVSALLYRVGLWDMQNDVEQHVDRDHINQEMDKLSLRAVNLDPTNPRAWMHRMYALAYLGSWNAAIAAEDRAIELDPYYGDAYIQKAWVMSMIGRPAEALPLVDHALQLNTKARGDALRYACFAHVLLADWSSAVSTCEEAAGTSDDWFIFAWLAAAYANLDNLQKATAAKNELLRRVPGYTVDRIREKRYSEVPEYLRLAEKNWYPGLEKAGLPER